MLPVQRSTDYEYSTLDKVREQLARKGLQEPSKPDYELPTVPDRLADLPGDEVITLFKRCESYYSWVIYQATLENLMASEWKNNLKHIISQLKRDDPDLDPELDEATIGARKALQTHEQAAALLEAHKSALHRRMAVLSRNVTVLQTNYAGSIRGENLGKW